MQTANQVFNDLLQSHKKNPELQLLQVLLFYADLGTLADFPRDKSVKWLADHHLLIPPMTPVGGYHPTAMAKEVALLVKGYLESESPVTEVSISRDSDGIAVKQYKPPLRIKGLPRFKYPLRGGGVVLVHFAGEPMALSQAAVLEVLVSLGLDPVLQLNDE